MLYMFSVLDYRTHDLEMSSGHVDLVLTSSIYHDTSMHFGDR